jgi:hypothetical protein
MDPTTVFCPNGHCHARGQTGMGNIGIGVWRILCMAQIEHKRISKYAMVANRTRM